MSAIGANADVDPRHASEQHLVMKAIAAVTVMLFAASPSASVVHATVTPQELALAINKADAALVPYRTKTMSPGNIRAVRCIAPDEEPTEFQCTWQQGIKGGWLKRTTWLAIDGNGWRVMNA